MHKTSLISIMLVLTLAIPGLADDGKGSDLVLSGSPGKSIRGRTLPPGTYRVVPVLGPGQDQAFVSVTLVEGDPGKPDSPDQPSTGKVSPPVPTGIPQADPGGTGPIYDCEYGLPRRDGANGELQLTPADLPPGFHLDDFANFNKACEIHQWIMHGPDRKNRIELSISAWNQRAAKYYDWKYGMLGTGEFEHSDISVGTKHLYVEQKGECNKQLIMQAGNYLVEMHRPLVEGLIQQTDPITRDEFVAVAKACEARINAVAGIPDKQMLDDNPSEFRWGTAVWPVSFVNGTLKVRGAGKPQWGTQWVVVDTGIQSYRGQGTGAGPVVSYTKDGKRWTVVMLNHETGARVNVRVFDMRASIMKAGKYGATLRIGGACYDYSWNHLEEIDCETGQFIHGGKSKQNAGVEEPGKGPKPSVGQKPGIQTTPDVKSPPPIALPSDREYPDWVWDLDLEILAGNPPEPSTKYSRVKIYGWGQRLYHGDIGWIFEYGDVVPFKLVDRKTGREFPAVFEPTKMQCPWGCCGVFKGQVFHGTVPCHGFIELSSVTVRYVPKGGGKQKTEVISGDLRKEKRSEFVHVNPPLKVRAGEWPSDDEWAIILFVYYKDSVKPVDGARVVIQGENTPEVELGTTDSMGSMDIITYGKLRARNIPRGIYTVYAYKRDKDLAKDLWPDREYKIAIPPVADKEAFWKLRIFMTEAGKKWNKFNLDEPGKRLNQ